MRINLLFRTLAFACLVSVSAGLPVRAAGDSGTSDAPSFTRTLYLVRHGAYDRVENGDETVVDGLNSLGLAQARLIAARLRGLPLTFTSLTSSTLTRARQTAMVIQQSLPQMTLKTNSLLCECMPRTSSDDINKEVSPADLDASEAQLNQVFASYFVPAKGADENDILVCHGNVIRYLVMRALGVDTKEWINFTVGNASLTIIQVTPRGTFRVLGVGDVGHIPSNLQSGLVGSDPLLVAP